MNSTLMYVEYLPALIAFIITLVWFCVGVTMPDEPPPPMVWGAMACVIMGGASIFLLPPVAAWFIVAGQLVFSFAAASRLKRSQQPAMQPQRVRTQDTYSLPERERFHDPAMGK
jgi:hypothetical protein